MIEDGLYALLTTAPAVTSLVGARVYPMILPNDVQLPAVRYQLVSSLPQYTLDGPKGFVKARIQVDAWGQAYSDANAVTDAIRATLDGYMGQLPNDVPVYGVQRDNVTDYFEKDSRLYRTQTDWVVLYADAATSG